MAHEDLIKAASVEHKKGRRAQLPYVLFLDSSLSDFYFHVAMFNETSRCLLLTPFPRLHLLQLPLLLLALLLLVLLYNCLLLELFAKACDWLPNRCRSKGWSSAV
jgi:hypothetical protein